jgi:hypothetical protein
MVLQCRRTARSWPDRARIPARPARRPRSPSAPHTRPGHLPGTHIKGKGTISFHNPRMSAINPDCKKKRKPAARVEQQFMLLFHDIYMYFYNQSPLRRQRVSRPPAQHRLACPHARGRGRNPTGRLAEHAWPSPQPRGTVPRFCAVRSHAVASRTGLHNAGSSASAAVFLSLKAGTVASPSGSVRTGYC